MTQFVYILSNSETDGTSKRVPFVSNFLHPIYTFDTASLKKISQLITSTQYKQTIQQEKMKYRRIYPYI